MRRFETGEQVLLGRFMGKTLEPPRCGEIRKVYSGGLFDYLLQVDTHAYSVRDAWLAPYTITISEDLEWSDT